MKKISSILFLAAMVCLYSCKKEDGTTENFYLTNGKWQLTGYLIKEDSISHDLFAEGLIDSCMLDDYYEFRADKSAWLYSNSILCDSSEAPVTDLGGWDTLANNQLMLGGAVYDVLQYNNTTLKLFIEEPNTIPPTTETITYTHL